MSGAFRKFLFVAGLLSLAPAAHAQIPAFPGAEGYGGYALGGRGGDVYIVTNLNTSGAGSFADAIATVPSAGRTIVFAASGHIHVNKTTLAKSKVTIAGQTAPGDGIGFKDGTFIISGDDIVIRHARFRYGKKDAGGDCINLSSGTLNAILDQVSIQFSTDENISSFNSPPENLTIQWALNGWGLESHSCGGLWDQKHATAHHSLWSHNHTRNPKARPGGLLEWVNNVTYDWDIGFIMGDSETPASWKANVRGCYFLAPAGNIRTKALEKANLDRNGVPNFSLYLNNCRHDSNGDGVLNGTDKGYGIVSGTYTTLASPVAATGAVPVTLDDPTVAFKKIVSKAGALRLDVSYAGPIRDEVDAKMVSNLVTQTRQHISTETSLGLTNGGFGTLNSSAAPSDTDKDGMPDFYETALGWNIATQDHNTALASSGGYLTGTTFMPAGTIAGYTRLEEYLHFKSIPHGTLPKNTSGGSTSIAVNMAKFTSGFPASPVFTTNSATGGSVVVAGSLATFTPTLNFTGRARFDFTVTDSAGHLWTQTCALVVTNSGLPRDITWTGALSNAWDHTFPNWKTPSGSAAVFFNGDRVTFDDSGLGVANVSMPDGVITNGLLVNSSGNYSLTGPGGAYLLGPLTKRGSGTLTITTFGTNNVTPIVIEEGILAAPNAGVGLGSPDYTLAGGTLAPTMDVAATSFDVTGNAAIVVSATRSVSGAWSGAGVMNFGIPGTSTLSLTGNTSAFGGKFALGASTGFLRFNGALGSAAAAFDLGTSTADLINRNGNATFDIGALIGSSGTYLGGASSVNAPSTYSIGANGASTTFAGTIGNGGACGATNIIKVGGGTLTLTGANTYTGTTAVSAGGLAVNGSVASATTVESGATLRGAGVFNGAVTTQTGAKVSPGPGSGTIGTLTAAGGFTATSTDFSFGLSASPGGGNDKISITGASGLVSGTNNFDIAFADDVLGAGIYTLIECAVGIPLNIGGGMVMNLSTDAPAGTRQTFALNRTSSGTAGGYIQLTVTGTSATLTWTGAASGVWDTTSANWTGAAPATFFGGDAVIFNDTSATPIITIPQDVQPRTVTVNRTTTNVLLDGPGGLAGGAQLVKNNSGHLLLSGAHSHTGGTVLNGGVIRLISDEANASALDDGPVTLNGGDLEMSDDDGTYNDFTADLIIPGGSAANIFADARCDVRGSLAGGGTLNFFVPWVRTTLFADWSAFTGTINVFTDASGGDFRIGESYNPDGYADSTLNLTANVSLYYTGTLAQGAGTTIEIGELTGPSSVTLLGGATGGRALTYRIGGKTALGATAAFLGDIAEQNTGTLTNYVKTGAGTWAIHNGTWNGGTNVELGILAISGLITSASATNVASGATLRLDDGAIATDAVNIAVGGNLTVLGGSSITGDLNNDGIFTLIGDDFDVSGTFINNGTTTVSGWLQLAGEVVNNGTLRVTAGGLLDAAGSFENNGLLDLLTSPSSLPLSFTNNGTVILNTERRILTAAKVGANFTVTAQGYAGHTFQLQRASALTGPWGNIGTAQNGTGALLTFTDVGGATGTAKFYRLAVGP